MILAKQTPQIPFCLVQLRLFLGFQIQIFFALGVIHLGLISGKLAYHISLA
jgi:hypothetical protein